MDLLFCPELGQARSAANNASEPIFVSKIKEAISEMGTNSNQLLEELYNDSAFTMLEKLLAKTQYDDSLMVLVFHLSHLLLRLLLFPDSSSSYIVFSKLYTY